MTISEATGRSTRTFRRLRAQVLAESDICVVCGHGGSDAVDHLTARSVDPSMAEDVDNLAPIHGNDGCPTCKRQCNREKGAGPLADVVRLKTSRDWFDA